MADGFPDDEGPKLDPSSDTWRVVMEWVEQSRNVATRELEKSGVDLPTTENLRGRLDMLRRLERLSGLPRP